MRPFQSVYRQVSITMFWLVGSRHLANYFNSKDFGSNDHSLTRRPSHRIWSAGRCSQPTASLSKGCSLYGFPHVEHRHLPSALMKSTIGCSGSYSVFREEHPGHMIETSLRKFSAAPSSANSKVMAVRHSRHLNRQILTIAYPSPSLASPRNSFESRPPSLLSRPA